MTKDFLFLGPQGSGKGTQAKMLAAKVHGVHFSSGDVLREVSRTNTSLGKFLIRQLASGRLTPIDKLLQVFDVAIKKVPASKPIIFDGFARQITETRLFLKRLRLRGRDISAVVVIDISKKETLARLSKRGQCGNCKKIFILSKKIRLGGECPACRGLIVRRDDDKPAAIEKRLSLYNRRTLPVIKFFAEHYPVLRINGEQTIAKVNRDIIVALKKNKLV